MCDKTLHAHTIVFSVHLNDVMTVDLYLQALRSAGRGDFVAIVKNGKILRGADFLARFDEVLLVPNNVVAAEFS